MSLTVRSERSGYKQIELGERLRLSNRVLYRKLQVLKV